MFCFVLFSLTGLHALCLIWFYLIKKNGYFTGYGAARNSLLISNISVSQLYFQGSLSGFNTTILCLDECNIYCESNDACYNLTVHCIDKSDLDPNGMFVHFVI